MRFRGLSLLSSAGIVAALFLTPAQAQTQTLVVGALHVGSVNDNGYNEALHEGVLNMQANLPGVKVIEAEQVPESADSERVMENVIAQGAKLVFPQSFGYLDPALNVAQRRRSTLQLGVLSVNPNATTQVIVDNTWVDPAKEAEDTRALVETSKASLISGELEVLRGPIVDNTGRVRVPEGQIGNFGELLNTTDWLVKKARRARFRNEGSGPGRQVPTVVIRPARAWNHGWIWFPKATVAIRMTMAMVATMSPYSTTSWPTPLPTSTTHPG